MLRMVFVLMVLSGGAVRGQELYRDWHRRVCPVLDTPYLHYSGLSFSHAVRSDTGTTGWGDGVSVSDISLWGRLPSWENDFGGELEVRGHMDFRVLEGLPAARSSDRQHGFLMLRASAIWHQRYQGGFGLQVRAQPGIYTSLHKPNGSIFFVPVGLTLIQALHPSFAFFAGLDYYPDFSVELDPVAGFLFVPHKELWLQVGYPETRFTLRPHGGRLQFGMGAEFVRWLEYRLGSDEDYDRLRFLETQAYTEVSWDTRGLSKVYLRAGYIFGREAIFSDGPTVELDDTPFVSIGVSSLL